MKFLILILTAIFNYANAGTLGDAYRTVCQKISIQQDFYVCVQALRGHSYFEMRPLLICTSLENNSKKSECVKIVGDITYDNDEVQGCEQKVREEEKLDCLIAKGHNYFPEIL